MRLAFFLLCSLLIAQKLLAEAEPNKDEWDKFVSAASDGSVYFDELSGRSGNNGIPLTLEQLRAKRYNVEKELDKAGIFPSISLLSQIFSIDCMMVTGDEKSCKCLVENRPVYSSYSEYTLFILKPMFAARRKDLDISEQQILVDKMVEIRNACVVN
ncbi:hypothetical protein G8764_01280 [Pseudomaricurvus alcaniphilus]|uniref:hypothetical protein n=1 Tax=Pseudomaricurvus alcaniphilus TaxID=1166482 RepID=UPI00140E8D29|nr:hypothetical protein [Pseudomaricurvus alcaniphilus]NHN35924.1 hypothetical protein [Pseudomaricurvus alcaniphilus]